MASLLLHPTSTFKLSFKLQTQEHIEENLRIKFIHNRYSDSISGNSLTCLTTKEFSNVFDKTAAQALPTHSEHDFAIDLEPGFKPPHGKVYSITTPETVAMNEYVRDNLKKDSIRPSKSTRGSSCFFVGKKDGTLRLFKTIVASMLEPSRIDIPFHDIELLRDLPRKNIQYSDLRAAHTIWSRISQEDEWKTAFICKGAITSIWSWRWFRQRSSTLQSMMHAIFHDLIGRNIDES
ncbi:hypothetical protein BASA81_016170 [Batrachochytrium salamandrivorans]|nr:hypothetical protein BASA81_016170 [Batrachochytrium salamandrivorans]